MAPKRPTAFEVSYPEDVLQEETLRKKREEDENERRRLGEILVAQQIDQRKLKRKEREQLKRKEKELRNGFSSRKSVEFDEQSADEVEVDFSRVISSFSSLLVSTD